MSRTTGVLRKLSHDKFIAVIEEQHLCKIINSKFEILDNARNITVGDRSNIITLSIGVGRGASTLEESESFAKQALDMCLGRGGDQDSSFTAALQRALKRSQRQSHVSFQMRCRRLYITAARCSSWDTGLLTSMQ